MSDAQENNLIVTSMAENNYHTINVKTIKIKQKKLNKMARFIINIHISSSGSDRNLANLSIKKLHSSARVRQRISSDEETKKQRLLGIQGNQLALPRMLITEPFRKGFLTKRFTM